MKVNIGPYLEEDKKRKVKIKVHGYDSWSADSTLAMIIAPVLKELRDQPYGYPSQFEQEDDETGEKGTAAWVEVIDKMIWAFEQCNINYVDDYCTGDHDRYFKPCEDNPEYSTWEKGPNHTFKMDMQGIAAHEEKMQEGFDLFAKYYRNLWS